jgi:predicted RNA binding protein YcfA (HicA-like mRNA interferase family)
VIIITKKEKLLSRIKNNPKTVKFEEIDKILLDVGFERRQPSGGSSHYTYVLADKILTVPYKKPYVKIIYVKMAIKLLEDLGY